MGVSRRLAIVQAALIWGAPILLIIGLTWPMVFTGDSLNGDWTHHLWLMWNQSLAIRANHVPSFFLNYPHAVFYPIYAFYGGTAYAATGAASLLLGNAPVETYILTYLLAFAAAYGGWYWMSRMAGLGRRWSHAPGLIFITSSYYLTLIYARGDWLEFLGVSMVPLMVASGLSVLRADRLRLWPALALVGSIVFFGNHNLTLIWGATWMALIGILVILCIPEVRRWLTWRSLARVAGLAIPAMLVNAWFLLPAVIYQTHTGIGSRYLHWRLELKGYMFIVAASHLFALSRASAIPWQKTFVVSLPVLTIGWALIGLIICARRGRQVVWQRMLYICAGLTLLMAITMTHAALILALPRPYAMLQYSYRLESYVLLGISATVLVLLVLGGGGGERRIPLWTWALLPILAVSAISAVLQVSDYSRGGDRASVLKVATKASPREVGTFDYGDAGLTEYLVRSGQPQEVNFPIAAVHGDRVSKTVHLPPGQLVYTNLGGGPELVHVTGARIVGITPARDDVIEIGHGVRESRRTSSGRRGAQWTEVISVSTASGTPMVVGRLLSLVAIVLLAGQFVALGIRRRHARVASRARV
jgi:hypothetical protein